MTANVQGECRKNNKLIDLDFEREEFLKELGCERGSHAVDEMRAPRMKMKLGGVSNWAFGESRERHEHLIAKEPQRCAHQKAAGNVDFSSGAAQGGIQATRSATDNVMGQPAKQGFGFLGLRFFAHERGINYAT